MEKEERNENNSRDARHMGMCKGMQYVTTLLLNKTAARMRKETKMSRKTLKMASLAKELFLAVRTWGL